MHFQKKFHVVTTLIHSLYFNSPNQSLMTASKTENGRKCFLPRRCFSLVVRCALGVMGLIVHGSFCTINSRAAGFPALSPCQAAFRSLLYNPFPASPTLVQSLDSLSTGYIGVVRSLCRARGKERSGTGLRYLKSYKLSKGFLLWVTVDSLNQAFAC